MSEGFWKAAKLSTVCVGNATNSYKVLWAESNYTTSAVLKADKLRTRLEVGNNVEVQYEEEWQQARITKALSGTDVSGGNYCVTWAEDNHTTVSQVKAAHIRADVSGGALKLEIDLQGAGSAKRDDKSNGGVCDRIQQQVAAAAMVDASSVSASFKDTSSILVFIVVKEGTCVQDVSDAVSTTDLD